MKRKKIPVMTYAELETLSTRGLLARLKRLQQCEMSIDLSDWDDKDPTTPGFIDFKNTSEWTEAYRQLKNILARREHIAKGMELVKLRQQKALRNKTAERISGRNNQRQRR